MAILGTKPVPDEEVGLLPVEYSEGAEDDQGTSNRLRPASYVAAVVTILLMPAGMVSLYTYVNQAEDSTNAIAAGPKYPLNFLMVGDWGREGAYNQTLVAHQMGRVGRHLGIQFVVSVGDNFYQAGLKGPRDPKFKNSFSNVYTAESLQTPWFSGNREVIGHCGKFVEFFFIDTTPFVDMYWAEEQIRTFDWRGIGIRQEYLVSQLKNLSMALESSAATWKIVVGLHTIRSLGRHGETSKLVKSVLPILDGFKCASLCSASFNASLLCADSFCGFEEFLSAAAFCPLC